MRGATLWTLTPGFSARFSRPWFDILVEANKQGLRDRDYGPRIPGRLRILGLGDSFAFGWGVEAEQGFYKRLEAQLVASGRPAEVVSAGIPGYGSEEALRLLEAVGLSYEPDLVLLAFYEGNDYLNNAHAPRRRRIVDGYLAEAAGPGRLARLVLRSSALVALAEDQWSRLAEKRAHSSSVAKTRAILLEMKRLLAARGLPLVVVFIPDQDQEAYRRSAWGRRLDRLLRGAEVFDERAPLEAFCRGSGIGFCRLSAAFEDAPGAARLRLAPEDSHFNALGHRRAAEEIHAWLLAHPWAFERQPPSSETHD